MTMPRPLSARHQALVAAAARGDVGEVTRLATLTRPSADSALALATAARGGHLACVEVLLPFSDDTRDLERALAFAAEAGSLACVERLVAALPQTTRDVLAWPLGVAARATSPEVVRAILRCAPSSGAVENALSLAAQEGRAAIVSVLVSHLHGQGLRAGIQAAVDHAKPECLRLLLDAATWPLPKAFATDLMHRAMANESQECVRLLWQRCSSDVRSAALTEAVAGGHAACAGVMVPRRFLTARAETLLCMGVQNNSPATAAALLPASPRPAIRVACHAALRRRRYGVADTLAAGLPADDLRGLSAASLARMPLASARLASVAMAATPLATPASTLRPRARHRA